MRILQSLGYRVALIMGRSVLSLFQHVTDRQIDLLYQFALRMAV